MSPEQMMDVLDCCDPATNRAALVEWYVRRALLSRKVADDLEAEAADKTEQAHVHRAAAEEFSSLAHAIAAPCNKGGAA